MAGAHLAEAQVELHDAEIMIADEPIISRGACTFLARPRRAARAHAEKSAAALEEIKNKLASGGVHQTKSGRKITRLGVHEKLAEASARGIKRKLNAPKKETIVWPIIQRCREQGMGYAATADINALGVLTPAERARQNITTNGEWYASTVRNIVMRRCDVRRHAIPITTTGGSRTNEVRD